MSKVDLIANNETEAFQLYHSDGALDLVLGTVLLNLGLDILSEAASASLFTYVPIIILYTMKNKFTLPRLSLERLGIDERKAKYWASQSALWSAAGLLILSTLILADPLGLGSKISLPWAGDVGCLSLAVFGGISLLFVGFKIGLKRFNIYAAVAFLAGLISYFMLPLYVPVFVTAAVMIVYGIKLMMEFSRQYPEPEEDKKDKSK